MTICIVRKIIKLTIFITVITIKQNNVIYNFNNNNKKGSNDHNIETAKRTLTNTTMQNDCNGTLHCTCGVSG